MYFIFYVSSSFVNLTPDVLACVTVFIVAAVPPFKSDLISEGVLQRLIKQNVIISFRLTDPTSNECYLYQNGKPCDYFVMILQGRVQVEFGKENLVFEGGPFVFFGVQALGIYTCA